MPIIWSNNAEGGVSGQLVAQSNSGASSGDAFTGVFMGSGSTIEFSNEHARGALSYKLASSGSGNVSMSEGFITSSATVYARWYMYLPARASGSLTLFKFYNQTNGDAIVLGMTNTGVLRLRDADSNLMADLGVRAPLGQWLRIELACYSHATAGYVAVKLFTDANSPHPVEVRTTAMTFNTLPVGGPINRFAIGAPNFSAPGAIMYFDDITISDAPVGGPQDPLNTKSLLSINTAETGTSGNAVDSTTSGDSSNHFFGGTTLTGGEIIYSNEQAMHGSLSYKVSPVVDTPAALRWNHLATNQAATSVYVYLTGIGAAGIEVVNFRSGAAGYRSAGIAVTSSNKLYLYGAGLSVWVSVNVLPLNTWIRLEMAAIINPIDGVGNLKAAYYLGDSTTAVESVELTTDLGVEPIYGLHVGKMNANSWTAAMYFDSIVVEQNTYNFIGPFTGYPAAPPVYDGVIPHLGWGVSV